MSRLLLSCCLLLAMSSYSGPAAFPEALTKPLPGALTREPGQRPWQWPQKADFEKRWAERLSKGQSLRLLQGTIVATSRNYEETSTSPEAFASLLKKPECEGTTWLLEEDGELNGILESEQWCVERGWKVHSRNGNELELVGPGALARFHVTETIEPRAVRHELLTDWTYVATLLDSPEPLYAERVTDWKATPFAEFTKGLKGQSSEALISAMRSLPAGDDFPFEQLAKGDEAVRREAYRHYLPMGRCSMDSRPQHVAGEYAELCYQRGEMGCFLQLQIRIMGDQFQRVAYSSYGEEAHPTESKRLLSTGIDVDRFFRGLALQLPDERASELGPSRLARAVLELGPEHSKRFEAQLISLIDDQSLDEWNRTRALQTYVSLQFREQLSKEGVTTLVERRQLGKVAKAWWVGVQQSWGK